MKAQERWKSHDIKAIWRLHYSLFMPRITNNWDLARTHYIFLSRLLFFKNPICKSEKMREEKKSMYWEAAPTMRVGSVSNIWEQKAFPASNIARKTGQWIEVQTPPSWCTWNSPQYIRSIYISLKQCYLYFFYSNAFIHAEFTRSLQSLSSKLLKLSFQKQTN